jgi:hypothetical protein
MSTNTSTDKGNMKQDQPTAGHDEVATRAYRLWEADGQPLGRDLEYWLQAETEIRAHRTGRSQDGSMRESSRTASPASALADAQREKSKSFTRATVPTNSDNQRGQRMAFSGERYSGNDAKGS